MQWRDEAIVLGAKPMGENAAIVELFVREHGRYKAVFYGATSRKNKAVLQLGNVVDVTWKARLSEQLGTFTIEPVAYLSGKLLLSASALYGVQLLAAYLQLLPERLGQSALYKLIKSILNSVAEPLLFYEFIARFELLLLEELGLGLDLYQCALTGSKDLSQLAYVSPNTGRAATKQAGAMWKDKLLVLPSFLLDQNLRAADYLELQAALGLTGFFLARYLEPAEAKAIQQLRALFINQFNKNLAS